MAFSVLRQTNDLSFFLVWAQMCNIICNISDTYIIHTNFGYHFSQDLNTSSLAYAIGGLHWTNIHRYGDVSEQMAKPKATLAI